ncbi:GNAT family N-acetyltransferase (plasmid) [Streptomyces sp. NBC_01450]|uniref:GNAT family N-acetyltransferase n=1 Tax=Streptomyces sp. NBC_01450 TaxID=2903871 RepID=UPI002E3397D1|nr:GNAT family N-acetyltransferase [Streptomyces sp. NBC_01450]
MPFEIVTADVGDLHRVLDDHARYWGERDLRALHQPVIVREFGSTCLVAQAARDDTRGTGLGHRLYEAFTEAFTEAARRQGAVRLKAVTSVTHHVSVVFHRSVGFAAQAVEDYDGPGRLRVVFTRAASNAADHRTHP